MKLYKRVVFTSPSLPPQPIPFRFLCQHVRKALRDLRIVKAAAGGGKESPRLIVLTEAAWNKLALYI